MEEKLLHGTTTVGVVYNGGVVLAADKRTSKGYEIANKRTEKVKIISDHMAITVAGLVSDTQLFTKLIKAQLALLNIRKNKEPTVKEGANLLANMAYQNIRRPSMVPGIVGFLLGGVDSYGSHLYEIGVDGSISKSEDYLTTGSGSKISVGVLEALYKKDMSEQEAIELTIKALNAAIQRDLATGNGIDVMLITEDGAKKIMTKEIDTNIKN